MQTSTFIIYTALSAACLPCATSCSQTQNSSRAVAAASSSNLTTIPAAFHGAWTSNPSGVGFDTDDGHLRVEAGKIHGWEWSGDVVSVKANGPRTVAVKSKGFAEGEPYESELILQLSADGSVLLTKYNTGGGWRALYRARSE